ncbi:IclR family transcriptional regulator [Paramicrobacterium chengjingii]|uniref:IclR family transcriptional regulator n=1 Tax=Paramicrobacterium chengjingii TaxID=2769067 RepID=A0ABX6YFH6_9MICO|nr:IclR family transcriptional regulator [Microbacterium chengjingii]
MPALSKAISILNFLAESTGGKNLTEIAEAISSAKSTTSNLCRELEESRLIARVPEGYELGRRTVELGGAYLSNYDQLRDFYAACAELPHMRHELVKVAVLDGTDVLYLARHEGRAPLRLSASIGDRFPAASTAVGNALLAELSIDEVERRFSVADAFPAWTGLSTRNLEDLQGKLALVRERGYAVEDGAVLPGVHGIAVSLPSGRVGQASLGLGVSFVGATTDDETRHALHDELLELRVRLVNPLQVLSNRATATREGSAGVYPASSA